MELTSTLIIGDLTIDYTVESVKPTKKKDTSDVLLGEAVLGLESCIREFMLTDKVKKLWLVNKNVATLIELRILLSKTIQKKLGKSALLVNLSMLWVNGTTKHSLV